MVEIVWRALYVCQTNVPASTITATPHLGATTLDNRLVVEVIIMAVDATQPTRVIAALKPMRLLVVASSGILMDHGRDDILLCTL